MANRPRRIIGIHDVAERNLCCGCGVCAYLHPEDIRMVDDVEAGRRPLVRPEGRRPGRTEEALAACPGVALAHDERSGPAPSLIPELLTDWGPVLELWEGFAGDPEIRYAASSGGAATALALQGIEHEAMHGVLHIAARDDVPYLNRTVLSRTREEMLAATGSRYAPASPCDRLDLVEGAPAPCVFIGKPCDVAALARARAGRPTLDAKVGLTIAMFCAGTPSTAGTLEMIDRMGISDPGSVRSVRYRGQGWPGQATVEFDGDRGRERARLSYEESWGEILQRHRQWRCYVCADHTGEFADIAVGDPWYREIPPGEPGRSLVLARTERGRRIIERARASGALQLERARPGVLPASQPNLLRARGATWGRSITTRALGVPAPRYQGLDTFGAWRRGLSARERAQSFYGTVKRVFTKRLHRRRPVVPYVPPGAGQGASSSGEAGGRPGRPG